MLTGKKVTLRELEVSDAPSLFAMLTPEEVSRFISPPPTTVEGFEQFITWARAERAAGRYACFAVVPHGMHTAVGLFQVRQLEAGFATAEWGFALGSAFWGTGMFVDGARTGRRLRGRDARRRAGSRRARAVANGRGNGALASWARSRKACCAGRSSRTASSWTRCSGPSWAKSGARPRPCGAMASSTSPHARSADVASRSGWSKLLRPRW